MHSKPSAEMGQVNGRAAAPLPGALPPPAGAGPAAGAAPIPRVFLCYRREDSKGYAGWISDLLGQHLGNDQVFRDIGGIGGGEKFREVVGEHLAACSVVLALIGPRWLNARSGLRRRLFQATDMVRLELFIALNRPILVIPVLVDGAKLPPANALPVSLVDLVSRSAVTISEHGIREELAALADRVRRGIEAHPPLVDDALQTERQRVRKLIVTEREGRRHRWLKIVALSTAAGILIAGITMVVVRRILTGVDMPCSLNPLQGSIQANGPNYGPDRKALLDRSQALVSAIPAWGEMTINLASGTSVENAFVVDNSDLSAQLRAGGNNWRGLSPIKIENKSGAVQKVVISAWFKRPPSGAATPWSQSKLTLDARGHLIGDDGVLRHAAPDLDGEVLCHAR